MNDRHTADTITDDALDQLYVELGQLYKENAAAVTALADMARKRNEQMDRADQAEAALDQVRHLADRLDEFAENALKTSDRQLYTAIANDIRNRATPAATDATELEKTTRVFAALHHSAEEDVTRVINLYEQWVKAGPPPLGVPVARWWDARLVELHEAIRPSADQPKEQ